MKKLLIISLSLIMVISATACSSTNEEVFNASANGFGGDVSVEVTFKGEDITKVVVTAPNETEGVGTRAVDELPALIVEADSIEVDSVAGATITSDAIKSAVRKAIALKNGETDEVVTLPAGSYEGSTESMWGPLTVKVELSETGIESIEVTSHSDTGLISDAAIAEVPARIVEHQSLNVDVATGATVTSNAIKAAVKDALSTASVSADVFDKEVVKKDAVQLADESYDLVIIGAGGAGLSAAIQARKMGDYSVLVLEKESYVGGSTAVSGGGIAVTDSDLNTEVNFTGKAIADYFAETVANYSMEEGGIYIPEGEATVNTTLIERVFDKAADVYDYFIENGFNQVIGFVTGRFGDGMGITCSLDGTGSGVERVKWMNDFAQELGAEVRVNSEVVDLVVDNGEVTGVVVESLDGNYTVNAKKVILATGGFASNHELVEERNSAYENIDKTWSFASPGNTGDVFELLEDLDASYVGYGLNTERGPEYPYLGVHHSEINYITSYAYCFVNSKGEIISNPQEKIYQWSQDILNTEDGVAYALMADDSRNMISGDAFVGTYGMSYEEYMDNVVAKGFAYKGTTIEELASAAGMDAENLQNAMDTANEYAGQLSWLGFPIDTIGDGPFYLAELEVAVIGTLEGVELNEQMQVLNNSGEVIPNLYAAGEVAMGNFQTGRYVTSSTAVGIAVYGGALAAEEAVLSLNN